MHATRDKMFMYKYDKIDRKKMRKVSKLIKTRGDVNK